MAITAIVVAAAMASVGAGTGVLMAQRQQITKLQGVVEEKASAIASLVDNVRALKAKATEFESVPKTMSLKRRTAQESTQKEITILQSRYEQSDELLASLQKEITILQSRYEQSDELLA